MKKLGIVLLLMCFAIPAFGIDVTIKDVPTQAQADRIKNSAMRIIHDMEEANDKKLSATKEQEFKDKIDTIRVANGLPKKYDKAKDAE